MLRFCFCSSLSILISVVSAQTPSGKTEAGKVPRKALLIGNRSYQLLPKVETAINDIRTIASALHDVGFKVTAVENLANEGEQLKRIDEFVSTIEPADVVLFYYTGHGAQAEEENFLLPLNYDPKRRLRDISINGYSTLRLVEDLDEKKAGATILIFDASRPLSGPWPRIGLASMTPGRHTLIAFSNPPNETNALEDPKLPISVFAHAFVDTLKKPGLALPRFFEEVGATVLAATKGQQEISSTNSGLANFYFRDPLPSDGPQTNVPKENMPDKQYYVWIPKGDFTMGCVPADDNCQKDEKPPHKVRINHGFWMGATEVTVGTYRNFTKYTKGNKMPAAGAPLSNRGWKNEALPIVNVSWNEAAEFCKWAGGRLPTEAEWEYAARGGVAGTVYPWGNEIDHNKAKYESGITKKRSKGQDLWDEVAPVRNFPPNKWGLYDVVGNAAEWVSDWYAPEYKLSEADDPKGPAGGKDKVVRGGSYNDKATGVRLSNRQHWNPEKGGNVDGFRCMVEKLKE